MTKPPLLRYLWSTVLFLLSVGLGAALSAVRTMQTRQLQQQSMKTSNGSTVTFVGFMTTPLVSSVEEAE